jgi:hypothetical protein
MAFDYRAGEPLFCDDGEVVSLGRTLAEAAATRVIDRLAEQQADNVLKMAEGLIGHFSNEVRCNKASHWNKRPRGLHIVLPTGFVAVRETIGCHIVDHGRSSQLASGIEPFASAIGFN